VDAAASHVNAFATGKPLCPSALPWAAGAPLEAQIKHLRTHLVEERRMALFVGNSSPTPSSTAIQPPDSSFAAFGPYWIADGGGLVRPLDPGVTQNASFRQR